MYRNNSNGRRAAPARGFMALCATLLAYGVLGAVATVPSTAVHAQSFSGLGFLTGGTSSEAHGVNADGTVVVGFGNATGIFDEAFRWTQAGGMAGLGFLAGGTFSEAHGVNADGTVVVGFGDATGIVDEAFRWTQAGGMAGLGFLTGGTFSIAQGVNADGTVVVGNSAATGIGSEAFRWTQTGGMKSVQALLTAKGVSTTGWTLTGATGVSADGRVIVGFGTDPNGQAQGWIADLGPTTVPFLAFNAKLKIDFGGEPNQDSFELKSSFTLSSTASNGIHPLTEPVTLQIGTFSITIPPGSRSTRARARTSTSTRTGFSASLGSSMA